jgi:hypothetical protein
LTLQRRAQRLPQKSLREALMAEVLVLHYSTYGHIETIADAGVDSAR